VVQIFLAKGMTHSVAKKSKFSKGKEKIKEKKKERVRKMCVRPLRFWPLIQVICKPADYLTAFGWECRIFRLKSQGERCDGRATPYVYLAEKTLIDFR